jgi:hypothetical protein
MSISRPHDRGTEFSAPHSCARGLSVRFFKVMMPIGTSANVSTCRSFFEENGRCQDQRRDRRLPGGARYGNRTSEPAGFDCRRGVGSAPPHG